MASLEQLLQRGALDEKLRRCALDVGTD